MKPGDRVKKELKRVTGMFVTGTIDINGTEWITGEVAAVGRAGWITIKWDDGSLESRHRNTVRRA